MSKLLNNLMQIKKPVQDTYFNEHLKISIADIQTTLETLAIEDTDLWIRFYQIIVPTELVTLRKIYLEKLITTLEKRYSLDQITDNLTLVWQHYKPLDNRRCQTLILDKIEKMASTDDCIKIRGNINKLIDGITISTEYAKELAICMLKTLIAGSNTNTNRPNTLDISLDATRQLTIPISNHVDSWDEPMVEILENALPTFEKLLQHMNTKDIEFTQLLLACILEPDVINNSKHLLKYVSTISLLSDQMSVKEIITLLESITTETPAYDTNVKLPELLSESYI